MERQIHRSRFSILLTLLLIAVSGNVTQAHVNFAAVFSDHMVLQREMPVPVWGAAMPNEAITLTLSSGDAVKQQKSATADADGKWKVTLDALTAGGPFELAAKGSDTAAIKDVLVGEVWIGSGQSNMELPIELTADATAAIAAANDPDFRLMKVNRSVQEKPQEIKGSWYVCTPENIGPKPAVGNVRAVTGASAVCYYFGRELRKKLNVPVGMIDSSFGGSMAEMWITGPGIRADPALKPIADRWDQLIANHPADQARFDAENVQFMKAVAAAKAASRPVPSHPRWIDEYRYGGMYNGMVANMVPLAVRGVLWYQGESNARDADMYRVLFPDLIRSWRTAWGRDDLPFLFVQLAGYGNYSATPTDPQWAHLRESQLAALALPHTAVATAIDIGEPNIHPKDKVDVARRLALCAEATVYGQDVQYQGPMYAGMSVEGSSIRLHFDHADGLAARQMSARLGNVPAVDASAPKEFAIAGSDKHFVWADAKIDGNDVVVTSSEVPLPVAVRYAWANNAVCNLTNSSGLPALPFRTDNWPTPTPTSTPATTQAAR